MSAIDLFNAATGGFIIGWWMRDIGRAVGALLERAAPTPRPAGVDDGAAEPVAGDSPARAPDAEPVKRPFADRDDNGGGHRTDNGDDDGFHAAILPQKQEAGK